MATVRIMPRANFRQVFLIWLNPILPASPHSEWLVQVKYLNTHPPQYHYLTQFAVFYLLHMDCPRRMGSNCYHYFRRLGDTKRDCDLPRVYTARKKQRQGLTTGVFSVKCQPDSPVFSASVPDTFRKRKV